MAEHYGYEIEKHGAESFHAICPSPDYKGGVVDMGAAHLHPLRLAQGQSYLRGAAAHKKGSPK